MSDQIRPISKAEFVRIASEGFGIEPTEEAVQAFLDSHPVPVRDDTNATAYAHAYAAGFSINVSKAIAALQTAIEELVDEGVSPDNISEAVAYLFPSTRKEGPL